MKIPDFFNFFKRARGNAPNVAVVIGGRTARFTRITWSGNKPVLAAYSAQPMAVVASSELAKASMVARASRAHCSHLLNPGEYQMLLVEAPNVPAEELKAALAWKIKDSLNSRVEETTLDVLPIPSARQQGDRPQSVYVVAAANDLIGKRMALFDGARLALGVIDIPELAQRNIAALFEDEGRCLAMLAFDENGGMLTFSSGGELYMARRIEVSAGQLRDANEDLRHQAFDRLELEVQRSLDYFDRQFNHVPVNRLLLAAPSESGLLERLADNLSVPVERLDLSQAMDLTAVPGMADPDAQMDALYALGAALRREGQAT